MQSRNLEEIKQAYGEFVGNQSYVPIFLKPFWLDLVTHGQGDWIPFLYEKDGRVLASYVIFQKKKYVTIQSIPRFTQFIGMWMVDSVRESDLYKRTSVMHEALEYFVGVVPKVLYAKCNHSYLIDAFLPLHAKGKRLIPKYTYRVENINESFQFPENIHSTKRRNLKKAKKLLSLSTEIGAEEFYDFHNECLSEKGEKTKYGLKFLKRLFEVGELNKCGQGFIALDEVGNKLAALYVVWDEVDAFHLIPVSKRTNIDGATFLVDGAIEFLKGTVSNYDFEGSMRPGIEKYYRSLATNRRVYYSEMDGLLSKFLK